MSPGIELFNKYLEVYQDGKPQPMISALISSLTENDVYYLIKYRIVPGNLNDRFRKRITNDIKYGNCKHKLLLKLLKKWAVSTDAKERLQSSYYLVSIIPMIKGNYSALIISFLHDQNFYIRRRGYELLQHVKMSDALIEKLKSLWICSGDYFLMPTLYKYAETKFLYDNLEKLLGGKGTYLMLSRLHNAGYDILHRIKKESECYYVYFCATQGVDIPDDELSQIISDNKYSYDYNLLIWSIGHMKKYKLLESLLEGKRTTARKNR